MCIYMMYMYRHMYRYMYMMYMYIMKRLRNSIREL